jgi:hypothetical protein
MPLSHLNHCYRRPHGAPARQYGHSRIERQTEAVVDAPLTAKAACFFELAPGSASQET